MENQPIQKDLKELTCKKALIELLLIKIDVTERLQRFLEIKGLTSEYRSLGKKEVCNG